MTSLTYVYPHRNRTNLFRLTLESLKNQTDLGFDITVVDNSDDPREVKTLVSEYRNYGLRIRALFIEPWRHPLAHKREAYSGNYNPALAQNIGVKNSSSELIVLSSPEVLNAKTNVETWKGLFQDQKSRFVLGWIGEREAAAMPVLQRGFSVEQIKNLCDVPGGDRTRCREYAWSPENYFLGAIKRADYLRIGGVEEGFLSGMAFDDNDFSERCVKNNIVPEFCGSIAGIHLAHSRDYQGSAFSDTNPNYSLYKQIKGQLVANAGREWGTDAFTVGEW